MSKRILVVGTAGQVGEKISSIALSRGYEVYGTYKSRRTELPLKEQYLLDKTNATLVDQIVSHLKPTVIVDTGALHNVDYCEAHPDEAYAVNRDGTSNLAKASKKVGSKFIFISTDFVFDGKSAPYSEEDTPNPESVYAKSKLQGEQAALSSNEDSCICRPSVVYSWVPLEKQTSASSSSGKPLNFAAWFVSQIIQGKEVNVVTDQIASPTLADDLAGGILKLAETESSRGLYHAAGATPLSRFEFAQRIAKKLGLNAALLHPSDSSKFIQIAKRPLNSSLKSNRICSEIGYSMMPIEKALDKFAEQSTLSTNPQLRL